MFQRSRDQADGQGLFAQFPVGLVSLRAF